MHKVETQYFASLPALPKLGLGEEEGKQKTPLSYSGVSDITIYLFLSLHLISLRERIIPVTVLIAYSTVPVVNHKFGLFIPCDLPRTCDSFGF